MSLLLLTSINKEMQVYVSRVFFGGGGVLHGGGAVEWVLFELKITRAVKPPLT